MEKKSNSQVNLEQKANARHHGQVKWISNPSISRAKESCHAVNQKLLRLQCSKSYAQSIHDQETKSVLKGNKESKKQRKAQNVNRALKPLLAPHKAQGMRLKAC
jgi:hypothetical protein